MTPYRGFRVEPPTKPEDICERGREYFTFYTTGYIVKDIGWDDCFRAKQVPVCDTCFSVWEANKKREDQ